MSSKGTRFDLQNKYLGKNLQFGNNGGIGKTGIVNGDVVSILIRVNHFNLWCIGLWLNC